MYGNQNHTINTGTNMEMYILQQKISVLGCKYYDEMTICFKVTLYLGIIRTSVLYFSLYLAPVKLQSNQMTSEATFYN